MQAANRDGDGDMQAAKRDYMVLWAADEFKRYGR